MRTFGFFWPVFTRFLLAHDLSFTQIALLNSVSAGVVVVGELPTCRGCGDESGDYDDESGDCGDPFGRPTRRRRARRRVPQEWRRRTRR
jgi:hypothetical protein